MPVFTSRLPKASDRPSSRSSDPGWSTASPTHNPGDLGGWTYRPTGAGPNAALVVVLHGCTQTARSYADHAGWKTLADQEGFVLLCPEQKRANNVNLCFNWFETADVTRGQGEVASIAAMVMAAIDEHALDPARVFVTGLSAGAAMTGAMLATYPELFAGGALIAGLPFGVAAGLQQALASMGHGGRMGPAALGQRIRAASPHAGPWPRITIWHGTQDTIVTPAASVRIAAQWAEVHGLTGRSTVVRTGPQGHEVWEDRDGAVRVEHHTIAGMAHGTPLMTKGSEGLGRAGPHMLDVGRSSTREIAAFWGLTAPGTGTDAAPDLGVSAAVAPPIHRHQPTAFHLPAPGSPKEVQAVIETALRAAGLMK